MRHAHLTESGLAEVTRLQRCGAVRIERVDPASPEARACVSRYFAELNRRFPAGFDPASSIPVDDAQLVPPDGAFLLAEFEGESVACGSLKRIDASTVYLKRMWVADGARGIGLGRRMLAALERQARELDFTTIRLETNRALTEAIRLYRTSGYTEIDAFNDEPYAHHWFEKALR